MRSLLSTIVLLAFLTGCRIHEPVHQIIYTPDKRLTNNEVTRLPQLLIDTNRPPMMLSVGRIAMEPESLE